MSNGCANVYNFSVQKCVLKCLLAVSMLCAAEMGAMWILQAGVVGRSLRLCALQLWRSR